MKGLEARFKRLRSRIDRADRQLLKALASRFAAAHKIGEVKAQLELPLEQKARWAKVMKERMALARRLGLSESLIGDLFDRIHTESIQVQKRVGRGLRKRSTGKTSGKSTKRKK